MKLVVEGPDHIGKTTFCNAFFSNVSHMSKPSESFNFLTDYVRLLETAKVFDRFHLGAYVYGHVLGLHPSPVDKFWLLDLCECLRLYGVKTAIVFTSDETWYKKRLTDHGKIEMFSTRDILRSNRIYRMLAEHPKICDVSFDIRAGDYLVHADAQRLFDATK